MAAPKGPTAVEAVRIRPEDLKARLEAGEPFTILDVRGPAAWDASDEKIWGAIRVDPFNFRIDPSWPREWPVALY